MALLYTIFKYSFKQYLGFGSVSPFWIGRENIFLGAIRFNRDSMDCRFLHITPSGAVGRRFISILDVE